MDASADAPPETPPPPAAEPATPPAPPYRVIQNEQEWRSQEQAIADRAIARYERTRDERDKQERVQHLEAQLEAATDADDWETIATLNRQLLAARRGEKQQQQSYESTRALRDSAYQEAVVATAVNFDQAVFVALAEALPPALSKDIKEWWAKEAAPRADGTFAHEGHEGRRLLTRRFIEGMEEHFTDVGRRQVLTEIAEDPEVKKQVMAALFGDTREPVAVSGSPSGGRGRYRDMDELTIAHANGELTNAQFLEQRRRLS